METENSLNCPPDLLVYELLLSPISYRNFNFILNTSEKQNDEHCFDSNPSAAATAIELNPMTGEPVEFITTNSPAPLRHDTLESGK